MYCSGAQYLLTQELGFAKVPHNISLDITWLDKFGCLKKLRALPDNPGIDVSRPDVQQTGRRAVRDEQGEGGRRTKRDSFILEKVSSARCACVALVGQAAMCYREIAKSSPGLTCSVLNRPTKKPAEYPGRAC